MPAPFVPPPTPTSLAGRLFGPRLGREAVFEVQRGPLRLGLPHWSPLALLYLAGVLALAWHFQTLGVAPAQLAAGAGPGLFGAVDLWLRLRTTHYAWTLPGGAETIARASLLDRLSVRECGWYLPLLGLPLPLWLPGLAITVMLLGPV